MTLEGSRAKGAFGVFNKPLKAVSNELLIALTKAKTESLKLAGPTTREFPLQRLRRRIANILALDVLFSQKMTSVPRKNTKWPNSRLPSRSYLDISPVWKTAPQGAFYKANKLSSLLHTIVTDGWKANIVHDLVRLSINVWTMSKRHFDGLCHRILSRIYKGAQALRSSPDPVLRFGALSTNPMCNPHCVYRLPDRRDYVKSQLGVKHLPNSLGLHLMMRRVLKLSTRSVQVVSSTKT